MIGRLLPLAHFAIDSGSSAFLGERFAGKVDLIYIDPPFLTGTDFNFTTQIGDSESEVTKEQSAIEEKAYELGYDVIISQSLNIAEREEHVVRRLLSRRVDGLFINPVYRLDPTSQRHCVDVERVSITGRHARQYDPMA